MRAVLPTLVVLTAVATMAGQQAPSPDARTLSPRLRELGQRLLDRARPELERIELAQELGNDAGDATLTFLVGVYASEPSATLKRAIVGSVAESRNPRAGVLLRSLERRNDADTLEFVRQHIAKQDEEVSADLSRAAVTAPSERVPNVTDTARFLVIGDFGTTATGQNDIQEQVARALRRFYDSAQPKPQFGITVGDNFYPLGIGGELDGRWSTDWENVYGPLHLLFYASLGNHDHYGGPISVQAQIAHRTNSWRMPGRYYTLTAGNTQLFAIDSEKILGQRTQMDWLDSSLAQSTATWKIVYGHHPVASGGKHGVNGELRDYRDKLLPVLERNRVDLYVTGHDHDLQMLKVNSQYEVVVGGSGKDGEQVAGLDESLFCSPGNGFVFIEAGDQELRVRVLRAPDAAVAFDCTLKRDPQTRTLGDQCVPKCP